MTASIFASQQPAFAPVTELQLKARALLTGYDDYVTPEVLETSPAFTVGNANANSTLRTGSTTNLNGGQISPTDPLIEVRGGLLGLNGSNKYQSLGMSNGTATLTGTPGLTLRLRTTSPSLDITYQDGLGNQQKNTGIVLYFVDPATGVRTRARAADYQSADASNSRYLRWDTGEAVDRIWEFVFDRLNQFRSINLTTGYSLAALPASPAMPTMQFVWDSFGEGAVSQGSMTTDMVDNMIPLQIARRFGCRFPFVAARNGTGFLNPGGSNGTYGTRQTYGDTTRMGAVDLFAAFGSLNDSESINAAYTDSALAAAMTSYFQGVAADQPNAIIVGCGPEASTNRPANQTRWDAMKAAFLAVAADDTNPLRWLWLDGSPSGDNWYNGITSGPDNTHLTRTDTNIVASRMIETLREELQKIAY